MTSLKAINTAFIHNIAYRHQDTTSSSLVGNPTIKIVTISSSTCKPSMRESLDLITSENFSQNFLKAGRAFVLNLKCHGSLLPLDPQQLALLHNSYKDRPMIYFFESSDNGCCIYFKDTSCLKYAKNIACMSINDFYSSEFSFELILSAMLSKFGGEFSSTLEHLRLNVAPLVDEFRLIDLAVLGNNQLCIRFLQLFENPIENVDKFSIRLLENAARICSYDSLFSIFDVNFEQKEVRLKVNKDLLNVKDPSSFNLLMISVENGNVSAVIFWLNLKFFDVNYQIDGSKAADLACRLSNFDILLMLLQNDSKYPKNYHKIDKSVELQMFSGKINEIHEAIRLGDIKKAKEVLYNLKLRYYYNETNKSAAYSALEHREFDIYKLLMLNNSSIGSDEDLTSLSLDVESQMLVKCIHDRYKSPLYEKCVLDVERKVKCLNILDIYRQKYQFEVRNALNLLFDVESFRPVLKIVASLDIDLILDFERESVSFLDPTEGTATRGYFSNSSIFIACKNLLDEQHRTQFLATLIHEMTHLVVDWLYGNSCRPFCSIDTKRLVEYHAVYEACRVNSHKDKIVDAVFGYAEELRYSELIVRVNHLMAFYIDNEDMQRESEENFPELFKFYRERIQADMIERLEGRATAAVTVKTKKRKFKDVEFDVEAQKLLDSDFGGEKKEKKLNFWKLSVAILFLLIVAFLIVYKYFEVNELGHKYQLKCKDQLDPWTDLIYSRNLTEIENFVEKNRQNLTEIFRINEICNPVTMSIERHMTDMDFVKDVVDVAEDAFSDCPGRFKKLLIQTLKYLWENFDEFREISHFLSGKLEKLMDVREHRMFVDGDFDGIGKKC